MQFQVPQFIETEAKLMGNITFLQFFYLLGGIILCVVLYFFVEIWLMIVLSVPILAFSLCMAFLKIHGRPFAGFLGSFFVYNFKNRIYLWKK